jgi:hypothetical protein
MALEDMLIRPADAAGPDFDEGALRRDARPGDLVHDRFGTWSCIGRHPDGRVLSARGHGSPPDTA